MRETLKHEWLCNGCSRSGVATSPNQARHQHAVLSPHCSYLPHRPAPTPSVSPETPTPELCQCGHDHLMPLGSGRVRTHACREYFNGCPCMKFQSVAASPVGAERESRAGADATSGGEDHEKSKSSGIHASHPNEAGRALDALIYTDVMGAEYSRVLATNEVFAHVPHYSTDIAAAWPVHLAMCDRLFSTRLRYFAALQEQTRLDTGGLVAWPDVLVVLRDRFPEAICRAALSTAEVSA